MLHSESLQFSKFQILILWIFIRIFAKSVAIIWISLYRYTWNNVTLCPTYYKQLTKRYRQAFTGVSDWHDRIIFVIFNLQRVHSSTGEFPPYRKLYNFILYLNQLIELFCLIVNHLISTSSRDVFKYCWPNIIVFLFCTFIVNYILYFDPDQLIPSFRKDIESAFITKHKFQQFWFCTTCTRLNCIKFMDFSSFVASNRYSSIIMDLHYSSSLYALNSKELE